MLVSGLKPSRLTHKPCYSESSPEAVRNSKCTPAQTHAQMCKAGLHMYTSHKPCEQGCTLLICACVCIYRCACAHQKCVRVMQAVNNGALCAGDFTALMANFGEIATVGAAARAPRMHPSASFLYGRYNTACIQYMI